MAPGSLLSQLQALAVAAGGALIGIDTSTEIASLCVVGSLPGDIHQELLAARVRASEALGGSLARLRERGALSFDTLAGIIIGIGPGSFTGLRVGLATAKGMGLALGIPLYGVSSLAILAASCGPGRIAVALDARRGELFSALYDVDEGGRPSVLLEDGARRPDELASLLRAPLPDAVVGDFASRFITEAGFDIPRVIDRPEPRAALAILNARDRILAGDADSLTALVPRYLRVSEAQRQAGIADM